MGGINSDKEIKNNAFKSIAGCIKRFFLIRKNSKNAMPVDARLSDTTTLGGKLRCSVKGMMVFETVLFWCLAVLPLMMADAVISYLDPIEQTAINIKYMYS